MPIFACGVAKGRVCQPPNFLERTLATQTSFLILIAGSSSSFSNPFYGWNVVPLKSSSVLVSKSINQRLCRNLSKMPGLSELACVKEENLPHASSQFRI